MSFPKEMPWHLVRKRHDELLQRAADSSLDNKNRQLIQKELAHLTELLKKYDELEYTQKLIQDTRESSALATDPEFKALYDDELTTLDLKHKNIANEIEELMAPHDAHEDRPVFLEIRAGTGGQEAALFAGDLMRMYMSYAQNKGWKATIDSESPTDLGGYREVILHIVGPGVYGHLKYESGVHRVQRVPTTETSGRVHTSTATVAVLPEAQEVDVSINPADLRIDVYRSGGAGGQHVNVTDSAVRITHVPTGIVVACQDERSQHKNKAKAMKILQSRMLAAQVEAYEQEMREKRKGQVGTGKRSEKARTYNFPQNRITDHQADITLKKLDRVMEGDLDDIIEALRTREREQRTHDFLAQFT